MPVSDTGMRSPVNNSDMSTGTRPKSPQETTSRSKLQRQTSMNKYEHLGDQEYKRNQFSKQESKDSGIVTEMALRPKDLDLTRSESMKSRNKIEKSPSMRGRSHNSSTKSKSGSMKYKQRSKTTSDLVPMKYNEENEIELLTPKQNGTVENTDQDKQYSSASIKGMWKKAFKSLKSSPSDSKLSKKASLKKKQGSKEEEEEQEQEPREIDPVYSLLKCAADLPKNSRIPCTIHAHCGGHHNPDSSTSTSKTSSPSSSVHQKPQVLHHQTLLISLLDQTSRRTTK
ncbi:unnamed protein product [Mytilus coruscus]|uniref:Uncharacterized protein n=1 Tax=Mytilus coruscus TaxID=42192 RepID=A0A6J8BJJ9_MYTCO|nr:unnamed protein product [Mytilus coruscus]